MNGTLPKAGRAYGKPDAVGQAEEVYSAEFDSIFFRLDAKLRERIEAKIAEIGSRLESYPHHRLKGSSAFRVRVGDYRIVYRIDVQINAIVLITLGHRREVYRTL